MLDQISAAYAAMVRMMQEIRFAIQRHFESRPMRRLDSRPQMAEQGLDLAPVNIGAERILKDCA